MDERQTYVTSTSGRRRLVTPPSEVASVLDLVLTATERVPLAPSVSMVGVWSCTGSREDVDLWIQGRMRAMALLPGRDWAGALSGDHRDVRLHLCTAHQILSASQTEGAVAAIEFFKPHIIAARLGKLMDSFGIDLDAPDKVAVAKQPPSVAPVPPQAPPDVPKDEPVAAKEEAGGDEPSATRI